MHNNERLVLTARETAKILGLSLASVYQGLLTGQIPSISIGRRKIIPRAAFEKMLAEAGNKTGVIPS